MECQRHEHRPAKELLVTNQGSNDVTKLRASDGSVLGTFAVGSLPQAVVFDGTNIWVTNFSSNTVTKLRASDGALLGTFSVGKFPEGAAFDGVNIWMSVPAPTNRIFLVAASRARVGAQNRSVASLHRKTMVSGNTMTRARDSSARP